MNKKNTGKRSVWFDGHAAELKILRAVMERTPTAMAVTTADGSHWAQNEAFKQLFGYHADDMGSFSVGIICTDATDANQINRILETGNPTTLRLNTKDKTGRKIDIELTIDPVKDMDDEISCYTWIFEDITEQKKIRKELMLQHEYLSTLHTISLGMFRRLNLSDLLKAIILRASKITRIPNGFLYLYNPEKNVLEVKAGCGIHSDDVGLELEPGRGLSGKVFNSGEPMIVNDYQSWKDKIKGAPYDKAHSVISVPLVSGAKIEGVIGLGHETPGMEIEPEIIGVLEEFSAIAQIAIDNAKLFEQHKNEVLKRILVEKERKEIEAKLFQAQRLESIGTLAGGIAHDFNNILSSIMGFTQIAMSSVDKDSSVEEDLNEILKASLRAKDLVQQILTFARQSDENLNAVKVSLIAKEVLKFIRSSVPTTIEIRQNISSDAKVMANPTQLYQVFLNIYTNAAQAMAEKGGCLDVDLAEETLSGSKDSLPAGNYIKIKISDTGNGIPKDNIDKIFEPYFTTKQVGEGTGLGLSVVHGAIKRLKGDIWVNSVEGEGTTFTIFLPVVDEKEKVYEPEKGPLPMGDQQRVLFVDDEPTIAKVGRRMLESLNYKVTPLTDSTLALELFRSKPTTFEAVVTDWTMPKMTGDKLAMAIKKINPKIPVILCTGIQEEFSPEELEKFGLNYFYKKPISKYELAHALKKAIDNAPD